MKALFFCEKEKMKLEEAAEVPVASPNEVLIKVKRCGICGTDVHIFHGQPGSAEVSPPIVLGHEFAGEVVAIGENVDNIQVGDRVAVDPNIYCGKCSHCQNGDIHLCDALEATGVTRNGGMAEYCCVPSEKCFKLPDTMSYDEGAMTEPLSCVLHGMDLLKFRPTDRVLIIGGGFIGSLFLQTVKLANVKEIVVSELDPQKHDSLKELGATDVITQVGAEEAATFQVVIECVGKPGTIEAAVKSAGKGGQILIFGVSAPSDTIQVSPYEIFNRELTIKGSFINPNTLRVAVELLAAKKVVVNDLLSHRLKLEQVPETLADYGSLGITKALIELD